MERHDNATIRQKPSERVRGGSAALDNSYNEQAGAFKALDHIVGKLTPLGDATAAINTRQAGALIALFSLGGVGYVKTGVDNTVAAPTGGVDGIPLRADDYTIIAMGPDEKYLKAITSGSDVWAYLVEDFTVYHDQVKK